MESDLNATFDACTNFNTKLKDTLSGLIGANNDRKSEIDALRSDHDTLRKDHDSFVTSAERENDLRKNEIKSLEEKCAKENQARVTDIAKLDGKLDSENGARKAEIKALDDWAKAENGARKTEIANLDNFAHTENDSRKAEIAALDNFAKTENDGRKSDIASLNQRLESEQNARDGEDKAINERISKEITDREQANNELQSRMDSHNEDRMRDVEELRTRMMKENEFLRSLQNKSLGVFFDAYRSKAYDGGGEENLTFNGTYCNVGGGFDADTGIFTAPMGGSYLFMFHIATHDNKKALLSIRKNGEEIASIFDQNHKDNHKNSMAGQTIIMNVERGDEIVVYAYTGTWLADFPMNHYTHWVGLLLKPNENESNILRKQIEEGVSEAEPVMNGH
jgi:hypothetical protein